MYIAQPRGRLIEVYKLVPEIYSSRVGKRAKSRGDLFLLPPFPFPPPFGFGVGTISLCCLNRFQGQGRAICAAAGDCLRRRASRRLWP
jgi:hypothetical protein